MSVALFNEDPSPEAVTAEGVRRTLAMFREHPIRGRALVLEVDGRTGGYAFVVNYWSNELAGEIGILDELYVLPELRCRGHATELLTSLREGLVAIELEVTPDNARARVLYERMGFRVKKNTVMRKRVTA